MKALIDIPRKLTHGVDLIVIRKSEYDMLRRRYKELSDAVSKIKLGEKELKRGKTRKINSLSEIL